MNMPSWHHTQLQGGEGAGGWHIWQRLEGHKPANERSGAAAPPRTLRAHDAAWRDPQALGPLPPAWAPRPPLTQSRCHAGCAVLGTFVRPRSGGVAAQPAPLGGAPRCLGRSQPLPRMTRAHGIRMPPNATPPAGCHQEDEAKVLQLGRVHEPARGARPACAGAASSSRALACDVAHGRTQQWQPRAAPQRTSGQHTRAASSCKALGKHCAQWLPPLPAGSPPLRHR